MRSRCFSMSRGVETAGRLRSHAGKGRRFIIGRCGIIHAARGPSLRPTVLVHFGVFSLVRDRSDAQCIRWWYITRTCAERCAAGLFDRCVKVEGSLGSSRSRRAGRRSRHVGSHPKLDAGHADRYLFPISCILDVRWSRRWAEGKRSGGNSDGAEA